MQLGQLAGEVELRAAVRGGQQQVQRALALACSLAVGGQRPHGPEEPLVQHLQQLQRRLVHQRARAARVHQGHVDDGRVVVARVLPRAEDGGQRQEARVGDAGAARVAAVHHPVQQRAHVRVALEQQHHRLPGQLVDLLVQRGEQHVQPGVQRAVLVQGVRVEAGAAAQQRAHGLQRRQLQLGAGGRVVGGVLAHAQRAREPARPAGEQREQAASQVALEQVVARLQREALDHLADEVAEVQLDRGRQVLVRLALQVQPRALDVLHDGGVQGAGLGLQHARTHAEGAVLGDQLEDAHDLQAERIPPAPAPHVLLLPVHGLPDVEHELLQQVLEGLHVDPAQGLHRGVAHVRRLAAQQGHDQLVQPAGRDEAHQAAGGGLAVAPLIRQAVRGRAAEETQTQVRRGAPHHRAGDGGHHAEGEGHVGLPDVHVDVPLVDRLAHRHRASQQGGSVVTDGRWVNDSEE